MNICITSSGIDLDSEIDPRFGRCANFIFLDTETMEFEAVKNENMDSTGGAGIKSAEFVGRKNVELVITGNVGPNAFNALKAGDIQVITGTKGKIRDIVAKYKAGELTPVNKATVDSHFGMGGA